MLLLLLLFLLILLPLLFRVSFQLENVDTIEVLLLYVALHLALLVLLVPLSSCGGLYRCSSGPLRCRRRLRPGPLLHAGDLNF
jgi:hypothetical protein